MVCNSVVAIYVAQTGRANLQWMLGHILWLGGRIGPQGTGSVRRVRRYCTHVTLLTSLCVRAPEVHFRGIAGLANTENVVAESRSTCEATHAPST